MAPKRVPHYIRGNKGEAIPRQVVCVDVAGEMVEREEDSRKKHEFFRGGHWLRWRHRNDSDCTELEESFLDPMEFWEVLRVTATTKTMTWIVGRHLSRSVTLLGMWNLLESGYLTLKIERGGKADPATGKTLKDWHGMTIIRDPPFIVVCRFRSGGGTLKFVDLANFSGWGVGQDIEKLTPMKKGAACEVYSRYRDMVLARRRCRNSAKWFRGFVDFVSGNHLGNVSTTAAGQSWNAWRHRFLNAKVLVHCDKKVLELEREAYYGGRNEAFYVGRVLRRDDTTNGADQFNDKRPAIQGQLVWGMDGRRNSNPSQDDRERAVGPIYHFDFNGLYPSVATGSTMPSRLAGKFCRGAVDSLDSGGCLGERRFGSVYPETPDALSELLANYAVVARVRIKAPWRSYQRRKNGQVGFCRGRFVTTLCGPELIPALAAGHVDEVYEAAWYHKADLFSSFVECMYGLRIKAKACNDSIGSGIVKLLTNSLFGRFGQMSSEWKYDGDIEPLGAYSHWVHSVDSNRTPDIYRAVGWLVERQVARHEHRESCPAIAAYITSAGRAKLQEALDCAGEFNTYYTDTDSLIVNESGRSNLVAGGWIDQTGLGKLKEEGRYEEAEFVRQKQYRLGNRWVLSGFGGISPVLEGTSGKAWTRKRMEVALAKAEIDKCWYDESCYTVGGKRPGKAEPQGGWVEPTTLNE